jgi:hypothetical protein
MKGKTSQSLLLVKEEDCKDQTTSIFLMLLTSLSTS